MLISKKSVFCLFVVAALSGCKDDSVDGYTGHWVEENTKESKPMALDISFNGSAYVIDERRNHFGKDFSMQKLGRAQNDGTVIVGTGIGQQIMALHQGKLLYIGRTLKKSP